MTEASRDDSATLRLAVMIRAKRDQSAAIALVGQVRRDRTGQGGGGAAADVKPQAAAD